MNKISKIIAVCFYFSLFVLPANAITIVDTGPVVDVQGGVSLGGPGTFPDYGQFVAAEFSTASDYTITDIQGWMRVYGGSDGTIVIYSDGGDVPGNELYSASFIGTDSGNMSWEGVSGLSWNLDVGTYWLAFEVRFGQTIEAYVGGATNPLEFEARTIDATGNWLAFQQNLQLGVRITAAPVPVPAAASLLVSGLIALVGISRRKAAVR